MISSSEPGGPQIARLRNDESTSTPSAPGTHDRFDLKTAIASPPCKDKPALASILFPDARYLATRARRMSGTRSGLLSLPVHEDSDGRASAGTGRLHRSVAEPGTYSPAGRDCDARSGQRLQTHTKPSRSVFH